jgi:hypothetical protein
MAEPQAEKTTRDRLRELLQSGMEKSSARVVTNLAPITNQLGITPESTAALIMGGDKSPLPLGIGVADFVPFLGTALGTEEAIQGFKEAKESAQKGDYIGAGVDAAFGAAGLIPGAQGTAKYGRKAINALRNIDLSRIPALMRAPTSIPAPQNMAAGGKAKALVKSVLRPDVPVVNRIEMGFKDVAQRVPELTEAANLVKAGKMSAGEYAQVVNRFKPVTPYDFVPKPATRKEAMEALHENKRPNYGGTKQIEGGEPADLRLDIPAYTGSGVWVNSIHRKGSPTVYGSTSAVDRPEMILPQEKAFQVATGEKSKSPFAVIRGEWNPLTEAEVVKGAQKYLNDPDWIQVGMDPERHSYFYDRTTMQPVVGGDRAVQIGPLVLVKNPQYGKPDDFKFAGGGEVSMAKGGGVKQAVKGALKRAFDAPQENALRLAQQRAALPVEQGGLGLPPNNTPAQRAAAMGFNRDTFHGSFNDIKNFDTRNASTESHAGAGVYSTESPQDASLNYANVYGPDVDVKINRAMEERDKNWNKLYKRFKDEVLTPRQQEILLRNALKADSLGVVYPLKVRSNKSIHLDAPEKNPVMVGPFEHYDEANDKWISTPHSEKFNEALDEFRGLGGEANPIYEVVQDYSGPMPARDLFNAVKKEGDKYGLIDPFFGNLVSGGVAAADFMKHFGVDEVRHTPSFRNQQLNLGKEHIISLDPENIRSRFAAFDPFRRNAAIAASMGVAAPDLLAAEPEKKASGGAIKMARGGSAKAMFKSALGRGKADIREPKTSTSIVKEGGGNWLSGSVEGAMKPLKRQGVAVMPLNETEVAERAAQGYTVYDPATGTYSKPDPMNQWIDKQLTRYVKNQMGTKEDPIRALAEKRSIHTNIREQPRANFVPDRIPAGESEQARNWDALVDQVPIKGSYREHLPIVDYSLFEADDLRRLGGEFAVNNPEALAYEFNRGKSMRDLGFDHLIDELRNATNPASGLPRELLIKPESLSKLSVPQAVERVAKINEWRAAQKAEADLARARNPATMLHKEYPEGYSWYELKQPEAKSATGEMGDLIGDDAKRRAALEDALKYEGEQMGHCVGGYCPDVIEGRSRIYSLRDKKGQPHVTIEAKPGKPWNERNGIFYENPELEKPWALYSTEMARAAKEKGVERPPNYIFGFPDWLKANDSDVFQKHAHVFEKSPPSIVQIKGKSNRAPNPEYLPFVQDFVKSSKWSDVGDFGNTGLMRIAPESNEAFYLRQQNKPIPEYVTDQEYDEIRRGMANAMKSPYGSADEGMKRGGEVRMSGGGKSKAKDVVKDVAKSGVKALKNIFAETAAPPSGVESIVVRPKDEKATKKSYSDKVLATTTARFEDKIAQENPKLSADDVRKKAAAQAIKKLEWERVNKPMLEKNYGPLVKSSYSSSNPNKMQNTPEVVSERMRKANEFLDQPTEPWRPPSPELQAFDRSSIRDALEGFPDVEQSKFPRDIPGRASTAHVDEMYSDPANRALIEKQIKRGLPLGGETFYASLYPVKQAVLEAGGSPEMFDKWVHSLAPASARNSILNENAVGQLMRDMNARGIPLTDENVIAEMAKYKEKYGIGLPLMPVHRQGVANVLEGGANLRDMNRANIPTNYKIPTYGAQKAGDFRDSVVLDVHEAAGQSQGSRYHPYFREQGGFGNTEYNAGEQGLLGIAGDLGIPGGMAQAGRWFGGGELTGLMSPRGDALDLIEKQIAYTLQQQGKQPNPAMIRNELLKQIMTGEGALLPWYKKDPMPDVRQTGLQRKEGGAITGDQHFVGGGATKKQAKKVINKMLGRTPADVSRAYATPEYIPGRGVGHLEGLVDESFDVRKGFSEQASNAFKDAQGRDVLHGALGLNPIPTRSMTGAFRPSGDIPFAGGRLGGPSVSGRLPMETQPGFALGNDININARKGVPKNTQNKLTAAEAIRGGMTGQHGSPWNMQIPSRKGNSLFVDLEGPVDPERMGLSAALQNGEGALADTGSGTAMINWGDKPSAKEAEVIANRLGGTGVTATKNISDYVDYSDQWMQPQGSGAVARKMLGYADELSPSDYRAISDAAMAPAGKLHDLYEAISRTRNEATRADLMNMLRILRNKGLPGIAAGLAAGEALPAEQSKRSGGLACLQCNPAHG